MKIVAEKELITTSVRSEPGLWLLFWIWFRLSLQTFANSNAIRLLVHQEFTVKRAYISNDEMTNIWSLCAIVPGVNVPAVIILIGKQLKGFWGVVVSLIGLILPSALIGLLLAICFGWLQSIPAMIAVLRGMFPCVLIFMGKSVLPYIKSLFKKGWQDGWWQIFIMSGITILTVIIIYFAQQIPVMGIIVIAVILGTFLLRPSKSNFTNVEGKKR